jgi:general secretion pathway protein J
MEALIASAMMTAILVALGTVTAQWLPNWARGLGRVQRSELLGLSLERVVADIAASEFVPPNRETRYPLFEGEEHSVTLVRSALGPNARAGLEIVRIAETVDEHGPVLVRMRTTFVPLGPERGGNDVPSFTDPVVLVRAPYRVFFSYAGGDRLWHDSWHAAAQLPNAVRVKLRDDGTAQTLSVSTATLIHIDAPAECVRAKLVRNCINGAGETAATTATQ